MPPHTAAWPLEYHGTLNLIEQTLKVETAPTDAARPVRLEFRATNFLSRPHWAALVKLDRLPLTPLEQLARHMGVALPEKLTAEGELSGVVGYTPDSGIQGTIGAGEALVTVPDCPPLRLENALVRLDHEAARLEPLAFTAGGQSATLKGSYGWSQQAWNAQIDAEDMTIASATSSGGRLLGSVPLLDAVHPRKLERSRSTIARKGTRRAAGQEHSTSLARAFRSRAFPIRSRSSPRRSR